MNRSKTRNFMFGVATLLTTSFIFTQPALAQQMCRWNIKFAKYEVLGTGGERKAEAIVRVSVRDSTVRVPEVGFKRVAKGDVVQVQESIRRITVRGRREGQIVIHTREKDFGPDEGKTVSHPVALSCRRGRPAGRDRTVSYDVINRGHLAVRVTVAFERGT